MTAPTKTERPIIFAATRPDPFQGLTDEMFAGEVKRAWENWNLLLAEAKLRGITVDAIAPLTITKTINL